MRSFKIFVLVIIFFSFQSVFGQTPTPTPDETEKQTMEKAMRLLRETASEVSNMRTQENRISFTAEIASLMWTHDEAEAKRLFGWSVSEFKTLITMYDDQMNMFPPPEDGERSYGGGFLFGEVNERSRVLQKFQVAMGVRQQITSSIAEHEPVLAFNFYHDSVSGVSNPQLTTILGYGNNTYFELGLLRKIAEKDAAKAADLAMASLQKGFRSHHVDLLREMHSKDPEKAAEFASAVFSRIKNESLDKLELYSLHNLISFGDEKLEDSREDPIKKPVYSREDLRELTDILARAILEGDERGGFRSYLANIEKYNPGRASQIRTKFNIENTGRPQPQRAGGTRGTGSGTSVAPPAPRSPGGSAVRGSGESAAVRQGIDARERAEQELMAEVMSLNKKELPKEEREKIVAKAREMLMSTSGKDKKLIGLSALAAQVAKAGDKELASELMRDAANLVNPSPKTYQDFLYTWMLISGYAEADPERAFPLLEDTIISLNEVIGSLVRVGEFIDTSEQMIVDGEVQVGAFGSGIAGNISRQLNLATPTIRSLIKVDFDRLQQASNRFNRVETRVLSKMIILRAAFENKPDQKDAEMQRYNILGSY